MCAPRASLLFAQSRDTRSDDAVVVERRLLRDQRAPRPHCTFAVNSGCGELRDVTTSRCSPGAIATTTTAGFMSVDTLHEADRWHRLFK
jgi:hypothetical protein